MSNQKYKVLIKGGYGYTNFGDDALMYVIYKLINKRFDANQIGLICKQADYLNSIVDGEKLSVIPNDETYNLSCENLVYGGGTQFYSFPLTKNRAVPSIGRFFNLLSNPKELITRVKERFLIKPEAQIINQDKKLSIGIGLGPFVENSEELIKAENEFKILDFISVRDKFSYDLCYGNWGLDVNFGSDLCFYNPVISELLPDSSFEKIKLKRKKIGIIIRDWKHSVEGQIDKNVLLSVVEKLRVEDYDVSFISFALDKDKKWLEFLTMNDEDVKIWNPNKQIVSEFIAELNLYDLIITARYHGAVFSSLLNIPHIPIIIEPKLELYAKQFGVENYTWYPATSADKLLSTINRVFTDYSLIKETLVTKVLYENKKAEVMVSHLYKELGV